MTEIAGLSSAEVEALRRTHGPNEIVRAPPTPAWRRLWAQFTSPVIALLAGACVVSAALGEVADAIAIGAIVLINGVVGFLQESRAERALLALRSMTAPRARVLRDGHAAEVAARDVVPGDLLLLDAGDVVAADAHLVEAHALLTQEAALTGESAPVEKSTAPVPADAPLAERADSVFMGTAVANGAGRARVVATGMGTELGKIAHLLGTAEEGRTPLEVRLVRVSRILLVASSAVVVVVAVVGLWHGRPPLEVFLTAVSLAVAAVPEGLPAIVTIALAVGVQRMAARNVLVRRLAAVETLGSTTVICSDKTGTLTTGVMRVREVWGADRRRVLDAAAACADAELVGPDGAGVGDPTEVALLAAAAEEGIQRGDIERARPRVAVLPFDSERKRMSIQRADGVLYVKGALELLLPLCDGGTAGAEEANAALAARGLRVLAVAVGRGPEERDLELLGLVGLADPPRAEVVEAVRAARAAGIRTVMITGDHPRTAAAIAQELGIVSRDEDAREWVHARATPADKLAIVRGWKRRGAVVAMTGDGVNDAPGLKEADIGVAMGKTGTEVAREASDMVLTDDNFASIVHAVREGRGIFDNIQKALVYLLIGNTAELTIMLGAAVLALPLPLLPLHLLWINLVTDGLPALALVMDPVHAEVMRRPPRAREEPILGRAEWTSILGVAMVEAAVALGAFAWALSDGDVVRARSWAFTVLVCSELFRAFGARSARQVLWTVGALTNPRLVLAVAASAAVQVALLYVPATQALFGLVPLSSTQLLGAVALGLVPVTLLEVSKLVRRSRGG